MRHSLRILLGICALAVVVASFFVDVHAGFGFVLRPPSPDLYRYWLPLLIFLSLVLCWLIRRLWDLVQAQTATFEFQDLDAAWNEALQFLEEFEIDILATPIFIVLGESDGSFFGAEELEVTRIPLSRSTDFAVFLQARGDAIYIVCPGASSIILGGFSKRASSSQRARELAAMQKVLALAQKEGRGLDQLTETERESISSAIEEEHSVGAAAEDSQANRRAVRKAGSRLRHLCRLITHERRPYCPINGILVLLPYAASATSQRTEHAASCIQQDLLIARRTFQVDCPVCFAIGDLQQASGAASLLGLTSPSKMHEGFGLRFPLLPDLDPHETVAMLESGIRWVCQTLAAKTTCRLMRVAPKDTASSNAGEANSNLFRLLAELRERAPRFADMIIRGTELSDGAAVMVSGFYLAASGGSPAFIKGLLREVHLHQNYVSWTPETLGRNGRALRMAAAGFTAMLACIASAGYYLWRS